MPALTSYIPGYIATVKKTANVRSSPVLPTPTPTNIIRVVSTPEQWVATGWVKGSVDPDGGSDQWLTRWNANRWEYTAKSNLSAGPSAPVGPVPDCTAAVKAATDPLNATIAQLEAEVAAVPTQVAAATLAGAQAEWDREAAGATVEVRLLDRP